VCNPICWLARQCQARCAGWSDVTERSCSRLMVRDGSGSNRRLPPMLLACLPPAPTSPTSPLQMVQASTLSTAVAIGSRAINSDEISETKDFKLVGAAGFEPATTHTPSVCATSLRHAPTREVSTARSRLSPELPFGGTVASCAVDHTAGGRGRAATLTAGAGRSARW
jgi:hypothetical protein